MNEIITSLKKRADRFRLQDSYAGLALGAVIVIVLGLLVANYFTRSSGQIGTAETITQATDQTVIEKTYKVVSGESLSIIADKVYGDMAYWPVIARENKIANPDLIYADSELSLPAKADADKMKSEMAMTSYQVQAGDTLFAVAEKAYGDGSRWTEIARANNVGYLRNGNPLIFTGSSLVVPR